MSNGPIILYDKSFLQGINPDEAFWLSMHFRTNLSPVLMVEVLGNLHKAPPADRTVEDVVRRLADKVSEIGTMPNVPHGDLTIGELLGHAIDIRGVPIVRGARLFQGPKGEVGRVIEEPPEMEAFNRWREQDFLAVERLVARSWREGIEQIDLNAARRLLREGNREYHFPDLAGVKAMADQAASPRNSRYGHLQRVLALYAVPAQMWPEIFRRWREAGGPPLHEFAPYTHHRLTVDLFFNLAIASGHISADRPTNKIDMAYLYYLPFCQVFVSGDRLHEKIVPLFMRSDQRYISARELKADLSRLVQYYDALPDEAKEAGALRYAAYPPVDGDFLTCRLHDQFRPGWRDHAANEIPLTPEMTALIQSRVQPMIDAAKKRQSEQAVPSGSKPESELLQFNVRKQVGRWKMF